MAKHNQREVALKKTREQFHALLEVSFEAIVCHEDGLITAANQAIGSLFGYEPDELIGLPFLSLIATEHHEKVKTYWQSELAQPCEILARRRDGSVFLAACQGRTLPCQAHSSRIEAIRNLTEHRQTQAAIQLNADLEQQIQQRTAELQQVLSFEATLKRITDRVRDSLDETQIMQAAVKELALALSVGCCNSALYQLESLESTICYEYTTSMPAYRGRVVNMADYPEIYDRLLQGEYLILCSISPNPARGRVAMLACPIRDNQGVLGDLWLINREDYLFTNSELRLVQQVANQCAIALRQARLYQAAQAQVQELEKLNRLKDDFLSTVSHELRTPVSNMRMAIQMLRIATSPERRDRYLDILQTECLREADLINDLLDLQRLEVSSYLVSSDVVILQDWLPSIVDPFVVRTQARQQGLQVKLPQNLPPFTTHGPSLSRILVELLNNACKYTTAGGSIILDVCYRGSELASGGNQHVQFIDFMLMNQAEIPATELPKIFDKFYRVPNSDPWRQGGTGLGLALVQKLVEQLRGYLQVNSQNGWTTFVVRLPI